MADSDDFAMLPEEWNGLWKFPDRVTTMTVTRAWILLGAFCHGIYSHGDARRSTEFIFEHGGARGKGLYAPSTKASYGDSLGAYFGA